MGNIVQSSHQRKLKATGASVIYVPFDPGNGNRTCTLLTYQYLSYKYAELTLMYAKLGDMGI